MNLWFKVSKIGQVWWYMPLIPANGEAEIGRSAVQD
jgi:hypothetical protein